MTFPDDENGQVLADMQEAGVDLDQAHKVDFYAAFEFEDRAQEAQAHFEQASFAGHSVEVVRLQKP